MDFFYAHHSGRYDRSPESLANSFNILAKSMDVIGFTEVSNPIRAMALRKECAKVGWGFFRVEGKGYSECAVAYDKAVWTIVDGSANVLTEKTFFSGKGKLRAPFTAVFILLQHIKTGKTYMFSVAHTPSHVGTKRGWRKTSARIIAHRNGLVGWRRQVRAHTKYWRPTGSRVISADWNLDLAQKWVRRYLRASFPMFHIVLDHVYLNTHDTRTIDGVLVGRRLKKAGTIKVIKMKDSDHKSVLVHLRRVLTPKK